VFCPLNGPFAEAGVPEAVPGLLPLELAFLLESELWLDAAPAPPVVLDD
jgi:hypothetical protein